MPSSRRPSTLAIVAALGTVYVVWGSTYYAIAVMVETLPPLLYPARGADALDPIGIGLVVAASLSWAAGSLYARRGQLPRNQLVGSGMEMLCGGVALLLVGALGGEVGHTDPSHFSTASLLAVAYLVVIGSLVAFSAYAWLLGNVPIS